MLAIHTAYKYMLTLAHGGPSEAGDCSHPSPMAHRVAAIVEYRLREWFQPVRELYAF